MIDTLNGVKAKYNWGAPHWSNHSYSHWIGYCNLMQLLLSECAMKILLPFSFLIKKTPNGSHYFGCLKNWTSIVQVFHELSIILPMIFQYFPRYFPIVSGKIPSKNDISHDFPILSHDFPRYFHHPFPFRTKASGRCRLRVQVLGGDRLGPTTAAGACGDGAAEATPLPGQEIMVCSSVKIHIYLFNTYIYNICVCTYNYIWIYIHMCANFEVAPWFLMGLTPVQYDFGCKATPWRWGLDMPMAALSMEAPPWGLLVYWDPTKQ